MALIKCPECKKDLSDSAKKCPHCGYINKKENNFIKLLKENRKIQIVIGIIVLVIIVVLVLNLILNKDKRNLKKMLNHLEDSGYSCIYNDEDIRYYCDRETSGKTEIIELEEDLRMYYEVNTAKYQMSIRSNYYHTGYADSKYVTVKHKKNSTLCYYIPENFEGKYYDFADDHKWNLGDKVKGYTEGFSDYGFTSSLECPYDYSEEVETMLREIESHYEDTKLSM